MQNRIQQMQEILSKDPLVGDNACQNNAIYLAYLARKVRLNLALLPNETQYLEDCDFLTRLRVMPNRKPNTNILFAQQTKKVEDIDMALFPAALVSKGKKQAYIAQKKAAVALASMKFICQRTQAMQFVAPIPNLDPAATQPAAVSLNRVGIPLFPFYVSVKMMLNIIDREALKIVAKLTCLNNDALFGQTKILYEKVGENYYGRRIEREEQAGYPTELVYVEFVNKMSEEEIVMVNSPDVRLTFEDYVNDMERQDILKLILLYAGNHDAFPKISNIPNGMRIFDNPVAEVNPAEMFNINVCSLGESAELRRLANQAGISPNGRYVDHVSAGFMLEEDTSAFKRTI